MKKPGEMTKPTRTSAFAQFDKPESQIVEEQSETQVKTTQEAVSETLGTKLKTKMSDYEGQPMKKTSVDLPLDVMQAWTVHCAVNGLSKRDHFLELLTKDLNKKR